MSHAAACGSDYWEPVPLKSWTSLLSRTVSWHGPGQLLLELCESVHLRRSWLEMVRQVTIHEGMSAFFF